MGNCDTCSFEPSYRETQFIEVPIKNQRPITVNLYSGVEITGTVHLVGAPQDMNFYSACISNLGGDGYCSESRDRLSIHMARVELGEYHLAGISPGELQLHHIGFYYTEARLNGVAMPRSRELSPELSPNVPSRLSMRSTTHSTSIPSPSCNDKAVGTSRAKPVRVRPLTKAAAARPANTLLLAVTPALPKVAFRADILEQYASRAVPITLTAGHKLEMEMVAIEDHPLARLLWLTGGVQ